MAPITTEKPREIVEDFAEEIRKRREQTVKPSKHVINFRTDMLNGIERDVWLVPIDLLRYRKDNGRIASDVLDYERNEAPLDEKDDRAQAKIQEFLKEKDPERTGILIKSIFQDGQREPAIITCDGFLINGNRRKMGMEQLLKDDPNNPKFKYMKVVILPGENDEGGPPTLVEIEKIENRYQLQSDGKSEYYGFDRALSIKRKIELGFTLEEQLRDDPAHAGATAADIKRAVTQHQKEYLDPLDCIDRYLQQFKREGLYRTVSTGIADPEGRWQAFIDYSNTFNRYFKDPKRRMQIGIEEDEIGELEEAAFDIIRLRTVPDMPKVHVVMRDMHKYCRTEEGRKAIKKIVEEVDPVLPVSSDRKGISLEEADDEWVAKNKETIIRNLKKASRSYEALKERETPIGLLEDAYKKLTHNNMNLNAVNITDLQKAHRIIADIIKTAESLDSEIYHYNKNYKKLAKKKRA